MTFTKFLVLLSCTVYMMLIPILLEAKEFSSKQGATASHSKYTQKVMKKMLEEISPEQDIAPDFFPLPPPQPKPDEEELSPAPPDDSDTSINDDDFFADEGFMDDDTAELSFEDTKKQWQQEYERTKNAWQKEYEETVAKWQAAKLEFEKTIEQVAAATIDIEKVKPNAAIAQSPPLQNKETNLSAMNEGEFHLIPKALDVKIKNQAYRGTCAAFTGVRAIETILMQHDVTSDFSEQHFYWMSKKDCQKTPCNSSEAGSWFTHGLLESKRNRIGVLAEVDCPYNIFGVDTNETQTPLSNCTPKPGVRAGNIVNNLSLPQVLQQLSINNPVMAGIKLSDNFYKDSFVSTNNIGKYKNKTDKHAGGHAVLLVGYVKIPARLNEGNYCLIAANSWGEGWGVGGFACLSEKWLRRQQIGFSALSSVSLTDTYKQRFPI